MAAGCTVGHMETRTTSRGRLAQDPERIRRRRIQSGLRQEELAAKADISTSKMSRIENGRFSAQPDVMVRLAEVLGCAVADLMPAEPGTSAA